MCKEFKSYIIIDTGNCSLVGLLNFNRVSSVSNIKIKFVPLNYCVKKNKFLKISLLQ